MGYYDDYVEKKIDLIKCQLRAADVQYDVRGVTLIGLDITDGKPLFLSHQIVSALSNLIGEAERVLVDKARKCEE